jgi:uncharacterized membrane protein
LKKIAIVILIGLLALVACAGAYYFYVGSGKIISANGSDWSAFGSYYGGVVGPILSFISIILLVYTINQQSEANVHTRAETIKLDMLRYLSGSEQEIDLWLKTKLASSKSNTEVQLGLIVWGVVKTSYVNQQELGVCLERLLKLTSSYCSSIALYEANVDPYFVYKQHYSKATELIDFLKTHVSLLGQMGRPNLAICEHLLNEANNA